MEANTDWGQIVQGNGGAHLRIKPDLVNCEMTQKAGRVKIVAGSHYEYPTI